MTTKTKKPLKAIFIGVGEQPTVVEIAKDNQLREMQQCVDGLIEAIDLTDMTIYVNEEGKLYGYEPNWFASSLWAEDLIKRNAWTHDLIVGNVIITGLPDRYGNLTSLNQKQIAKVLNKWEA